MIKTAEEQGFFEYVEIYKAEISNHINEIFDEAYTLEYGAFISRVKQLDEIYRICEKIQKSTIKLKNKLINEQQTTIFDKLYTANTPPTQ